MQNLFHRFSTEFKGGGRLHIFCLALLCVLLARSSVTQESSQSAVQQSTQSAMQESTQPDSQQMVLANPSATPPACYLDKDLVQTSQQDLVQAGQQDLMQTRQQDLEQADQQNPVQATQQDIDGTSNQPVMPADQIISILQQNPDVLANFKDIAGQRYGVDPTTISDNGIYNCIWQDPALRSQASAALITQGYATNIETVKAAPARKLSSAQPRPAEPSSDARTHRPTPYPNLPSLVDLYSQDVATSSNMRRFGSDMFRFGTGNANQLPMDLPVGPDYVLGPGDNLILNMWGGQSNRLDRTIDRQGQIALPEAGAITISGLTISQAQSAIQQALGTQFQNERVEISLGRVRTVRVYVVGDVQRPGAYDVSSLSTPLNALYVAGGPTSRGSLRVLRQYRGKQLVREIDLYDFLLQGVRSDLDRLLPGDTILVPPVGPQVTVAGMVRRPAIYELKGEQDIKDVLNLAGGLLVTASLQEIRVERVEAHERRTMLGVRLPESPLGDITKLPAFQVEDGDKVVVSPILPYNSQVVFLDGHVFKPGPYAWRDGMTVNDLLHSYQDVMPEPASHAEIIRLQPPDFRPETMSFNLPDTLVGNDQIALQPFDVVRIFGRYEIDPPRVSIFGEVIRPGDYPMSEGMTVSGLVRMAGGFRRSAYREEADLSYYEIQNGQNVLIKHSVVDIAKALSGDKNADVVLQPGDVVGIRQLTGWQDIGASVTVNGEVQFAGTYGIEEGERLSSVLKRARGFREEAYPAGAVLERVQVRQMEENNRQEMIRRIESSTPNIAPGLSTPQEQQNLLQTMQQQQQQVLASLRSHPSTGRLVIRISANIGEWENTPADIEMRAGDTLSIPKRPDFVLVSGQVYNATGITFRPGKDARWYLRQAGGVTRSGDKRNIFIVRADGSVVGSQGGAQFGKSVLDIRLRPGDSIIVPEKVFGGSQIWRNLIGTAQIMSSVALTGAVSGAF